MGWVGDSFQRFRGHKRILLGVGIREKADEKENLGSGFSDVATPLTQTKAHLKALHEIYLVKLGYNYGLRRRSQKSKFGNQIKGHMSWLTSSNLLFDRRRHLLPFGFYMFADVLAAGVVCM